MQLRNYTLYIKDILSENELWVVTNPDAALLSSYVVTKNILNNEVPGAKYEYSEDYNTRTITLGNVSQKEELYPPYKKGAFVEVGQSPETDELVELSAHVWVRAKN